MTQNDSSRTNQMVLVSSTAISVKVGHTVSRTPPPHGPLWPRFNRQFAMLFAGGLNGDPYVLAEHRQKVHQLAN